MNLLEQLENRRLYSTVSLVNGVLTVTGTEADDSIQVGKTVTGQIRVTENNQQTELGVFGAASVTKVVVSSLGGDDNVLVHVHASKQVEIKGGEGDDTLLGGEGKDTLNGGAGNDRITGNGDNDSLLGGEGNDTLKGNSGNDSLYGQGGDDEFVTDFNTGPNPPPVLDGDDLLSGGGGVDLANYATRPTAQNLTIDNVANDGLVASGEHDNIQTDVENVKGGQGTDYIAGSSAANSIDGQAGNDTIYGGSGNDTITGSTGNDRIYGQAGNDQLEGYIGNDTIRGGSGADRFDGGAGTDTADYGDSFSNLTITLNNLAGDGAIGEHDNVTNTIENVLGGFGNDKITGDAGNNLLTGGFGNDTIYGGGGNDILRGLGGNDSLFGQAGADSLEGGDGDDVLQGGADLDTLVGGTGNDLEVQ